MDLVELQPVEIDLLCSFHILGRVSTIGVRVMVFNATFNNISVISWRSVLLVDETGDIFH
jgi:hypothetical protein